METLKILLSYLPYLLWAIGTAVAGSIPARQLIHRPKLSLLIIIVSVVVVGLLLAKGEGYSAWQVCVGSAGFLWIVTGGGHYLLKEKNPEGMFYAVIGLTAVITVLFTLWA